MNRRQMAIRKRREMIKWGLLFGRLIILIIIVLCIRNIYAYLKDIQTELNQLKIQQYGVTWRDEGEQEEEDGEMGYVGSIDVWDVEKPAERTEVEVLQRLKELGETSSVIAEIARNNSLYPKELLAALANNPEMADFVAGYPDENGESGEGITTSEMEQGFPLFLQWDPRWGYQPYGTGNCIGLAGCGPTCLSMVLFGLTRDKTLTPDEIARYSMENGYYVEGTGTAWALMEDLPKLYGIRATKLSLSENNMRAALDGGSMIICAMGKGDFTASGHYIVIYGYDSGGFMVNDPNCVARSSKRWTFSEIRYQIKNIWAYSFTG